ncbi:MAG: aminotransferase class V-fold PLP-dependent enzyme [Pseudonocardiaceae bacterium]
MTEHPARGYLDTPSMGLPPPATVAAVRAAVEAWADGSGEYADWEKCMQTCRRLFAQLAGAPADTVGLLGSVVPAVAAAGATLARREGMVVAHRAEFRSLLLPVIAQVPPGRIRWVDGPYLADTFTASVDERTDAVLVSAISSHDGARPALSRLIDACDSVGADLLVDGTQAMGIVVPDVDVARLGLLAVAGYKGLRGPRGAAYAIARPHLVEHFVAPSPYGMADADRNGTYGPPLQPKPAAAGLDQSPAWLSWVGARPALAELVDQPAAERERQVLSLADRMREHLHRLRLSPQESDLPSPIVTFAVSAPEEVTQRLRQAGVRVAARRGRIRAGLHVYNDEVDVDLFAHVLADCGTGMVPASQLAQRHQRGQ